MIRFGLASSNHHLTAIKGFTRWLVRDHRCGDDMLSHLSRMNAKTDVRRERRHITIEDFSKLIDATRRNADRAGLSGPDRAELYFIAGYTGLRASELASLSESSFDLDAGNVTVEAAYSKHRERDVLPLPSAVITRLREWFQERRDRQAGSSSSILTMSNKTDDTQEPLWPGTWASRRHGADMLRFDLKAADIPYVDDRGKVFDFHALRHQFISMLAASGGHPKVAQQLARHSDINLTMSRYTHVHLADLSSAVDTLPALRPTESRMELQTGTDGIGKCEHGLAAQKAALAGDISCDSVRLPESRDPRERPSSRQTTKHAETPVLQGSESDCDSLGVAEIASMRETGIEPARVAPLDPKSSASASSATLAAIGSLVAELVRVPRGTRLVHPFGSLTTSATFPFIMLRMPQDWLNPILALRHVPLACAAG